MFGFIIYVLYNIICLDSYDFRDDNTSFIDAEIVS